MAKFDKLTGVRLDPETGTVPQNPPQTPPKPAEPAPEPPKQPVAPEAQHYPQQQGKRR